MFTLFMKVALLGIIDGNIKQCKWKQKDIKHSIRNAFQTKILTLKKWLYYIILMQLCVIFANFISSQVSTLSTLNETVCDCTNPPGNSFATTFYVSPNTIDLSSVFSKFDLKDNAAVFSTVICLVIVYILICVWAVKQDKKDIIRVNIFQNYK